MRLRLLVITGSSRVLLVGVILVGWSISWWSWKVFIMFFRCHGVSGRRSFFRSPMMLTLSKGDIREFSVIWANIFHLYIGVLGGLYMMPRVNLRRWCVISSQMFSRFWRIKVMMSVCNDSFLYVNCNATTLVFYPIFSEWFFKSI